MIAKHTGGGKIELAPMAIWSLGAAIVGAGIYVGTHVSDIEANAEDIKGVEAALKQVHVMDRRLVQVETSLHTVTSQQISVQNSLAKTREENAATQANQKNLSKQVEEVQKGVKEIQRLIRGLGAR